MDTKHIVFMLITLLTITYLATYTHVMNGLFYGTDKAFFINEDLMATNDTPLQLGLSSKSEGIYKRGNLNSAKPRMDVSLHKRSTLPNRNQYPHYLMSHPLGRLGNQLFEFASSLGIARSLNYTHVIRPSHPLLMFFQMTNTSSVKLTNIMQITEYQWRNKNWRANKKFMSFNLTLNGYFQSRKFFENSSDEVRKALAIKRKFTEQAEAFLDKHIHTKHKTIIGVHVRRGDFLRDVEIKLGRVVASSYYFRQAKMYFKRKYKDTVFVVISDDIKWCKQNIADNNTIFSTFNTPIMDMALMSLCHHMITSTGTFSWWCGWFCSGTVTYMKDYPRPGSPYSREPKFKEGFHLPAWIGIGNS